MDEAAGSVLDASALLTCLRGEPGSRTAEEALAAGAVINVVNYADVLSRLGDAGEEPSTAHCRLQDHRLIGGLLQVVSLTEDDAVAIARLRVATRTQGLSVGDRACLATGLRLDRPVVTADRSWASLGVGLTIRLIRS